jgi:hypothetical protein
VRAREDGHRANMHVNAALLLKENYTPRTGSGQDNGATEEGSDVSPASAQRRERTKRGRRPPASAEDLHTHYYAAAAAAAAGRVHVTYLDSKSRPPRLQLLKAGAHSGGGIGRSFHE